MRVAVVNHWPHALTAEFEFLQRMKVVLAERDIDLVVIGPDGFLLDGPRKGAPLQQDDADFLLAFDPSCTEFFCDIPLYSPLWIPPGFISLNNYSSYLLSLNKIDSFLGGYSSEPMKAHLAKVLKYHGRRLNDLLLFCAAPSEKQVLLPKTDGPFRLAYVGVNCERIGARVGEIRRGRHHETFKILDHSRDVSFYGPKRFGGIQPWHGYDCYKGEIPFDGGSLLKTLNSEGIALVISSEIHRIDGVVTSRLFEALAAGCVIISDRNAFVESFLKDSVLYISIDAKPEEVAHEISCHIRWVNEHSEEARKLAKKAQDIFLREFTLERSIDNLLQTHEAYLSGAMFSQDTLVDVVVPFRGGDVFAIAQNVLRQTHKRIHAIFVCNKQEDIALFQKQVKGAFPVDGLVVEAGTTSGQMVQRAIEYLQGDSFVIAEINQHWHRNHVSRLVASLFSDVSCRVSCAQSYVLGDDGSIIAKSPNDFSLREFLSLSLFCSPQTRENNSSFFVEVESVFLKSCLLFRSSVLEGLPADALQEIDGCEHLYFLIRSLDVTASNFGLKSTYTRSLCLKAMYKQVSPENLYPYRGNVVDALRAHNTTYKMLMDIQLIDPAAQVSRFFPGCAPKDFAPNYSFPQNVIRALAQALRKSSLPEPLKKFIRLCFHLFRRLGA